MSHSNLSRVFHVYHHPCADVSIASTMVTAGSPVGDDTSGPLPARIGAIASHCITAIIVRFRSTAPLHRSRRTCRMTKCVSARTRRTPRVWKVAKRWSFASFRSWWPRR